MDWTLTVKVPETLTFDFSFVPWMVLGYFLWGAAVMMTILKANKDGKQNQGSSQDLSKSNRLGIVVFGAFCWPWFIYDLMKDAAELEEKTEGENQ